MNVWNYAHERSLFKQLTWGVFSCLGVRHLNKGQNASYMDLIWNASFRNDSLLERMVGSPTHYKHFLVCLWSCSVISLPSLSFSSFCQSCYSVFHHLALFLPYECLIAHVSYRHSKSQVFKDILQILPGAISLKLVQWISGHWPMSSERCSTELDNEKA